MSLRGNPPLAEKFLPLQDNVGEEQREAMGGPRSFSIAAAVDAVLLMTTTGIAFAFILKGKVQQHRQWMTRSFAVALVFLEVRVILGVTGWEKLGIAATETVVWACRSTGYRCQAERR